MAPKDPQERQPRPNSAQGTFQPFNTEIEHRGRKYHVQTQDLGDRTRAIVTQTLTEGLVIVSKRADYPHAATDVELRDRVHDLMKEHHKTALKAIIHDQVPGAAAISRPPISEQETPLAMKIAGLGSMTLVPPTRAAHLEVVRGRWMGLRLALFCTPMALGRETVNPLSVDDPSLAPSHALFSFHALEGWSVTELGNALTLVNGRRCTGKALVSGDVITAGGVELRFSESTPVRPAPPPVHAAPPALPAEMALIPPVRWDITSGGIDVRAFLLEKAPVTNAQYAEYLRSTGAMPCEAWLTSRPGSPLMNHPVVGLTFAEAEAYASWKRRRLPTALEWEAAARGPAGRKYPWGDSWGSDCCHSRESGGRGTMPIGSKPAGASPDGVVDLFGNVWEWTAIDPRLPTPDEAQTWVMGGAYNTECKGEGKIPRVAVRMTKGYMYLGFRCAADLGGS